MESHRTLDTSAEELFGRVLEKVQGKFTIESKAVELGVKLLTQFDQLRDYERLYIHKVTELRSASVSFIILLAEKHSIVIKQLRSGLRYEEEIEEIEPLLFFTLAHDLGKVIVRKETFGDRIADIFKREDVDFEGYPTFNKNYYVVGDCSERVKAYFPQTLILALEKTNDMTVEINGKLGLARTEKNLTEDLLLQLINLGSQTAEHRAKDIEDERCA